MYFGLYIYVPIETTNTLGKNVLNNHNKNPSKGIVVSPGGGDLLKTFPFSVNFYHEMSYLNQKYKVISLWLTKSSKSNENIHKCLHYYKKNNKVDNFQNMTFSKAARECYCSQFLMPYIQYLLSSYIFINVKHGLYFHI